MAIRKGVGNKGKKRMATAGGVLMMTSMLDILTTILFFLLKNYSYVVTTFNVSAGLSLPQSTAILPPPESTLQLVVTKTAIMLDDKELVVFENGVIPSQKLRI